MSPHQRLRRDARERRRALTRSDQSRHSIAVTRHIVTSSWFLRSRTIGLYLAADGELDLGCFIEQARHCKKRLLLPVLRSAPGVGLWFVEHRSDEPLSRNRFDIEEPDIRKRAPTPPWAIDLVLMPLVAFDTEGNRLGMGGGFYDRSFAYKDRRRHARKPILIGVAHDCQRMQHIPARSWDIPMNGVVTERGLYRFNATSHPAL